LETHFIPYRNSTIHYYRFGQGAEWLFCFHGYGENGGSFEIFETLLGDRYTLISLDFPFHGETVWLDGLLFDTNDLISIINLIKPTHQPMSLLGYSMGGRVALQLLQVMPGQIKKLVLVAPDGLHKNKWQWLSTRTKIGNRLFAYIMHKPEGLIGLMDLAGKLGLYNKSIRKFVHFYLDDAVQRSILYRRWTTMRKFRPDTTLLKRIVVDHQVPIRLLFGRYDSIILSKHGTAFGRESEGLIRVIEIEAGHQLLREKHVTVISEMVGGEW